MYEECNLVEATPGDLIRFEHEGAVVEGIVMFLADLAVRPSKITVQGVRVPAWLIPKSVVLETREVEILAHRRSKTTH